MPLQRSFTFSEGGWTFHYIARSQRLQVYLPVQNRHTGITDPMGEHEDEDHVALGTQAEGRAWAKGWVEENGTADDYKRALS